MVLVRVSLLILVLLWPLTLSAQTTHDAQQWTMVIVTAPVAPGWLVHLEGQPRWSEDMSELNQVIVRTALGKRLTPRLTLWGGHAWVPRTLGPGTRHEQRIWEQLSVTLPNVERWAPSLRFRVEQRFLDGWADNSHRVRLMGRAVRPLDRESRWSLVASNELMLNADETDAGPWQGVDQNRLFGGVLRRLSRTTTVEAGYLWQTLKPPAGRRANAHVAFVWLNVVL